MLTANDDTPQTIQEGYAALRQVLGFNDPERPDKPKPSDLAILNAALKALRDTQRERTGLARLSDPTAPGWRDLDYEEPPHREPVLLKTEDGAVFIGTFEGYGELDEDGDIDDSTIEDEADDEAGRDTPVFETQDDDPYDGDAPVFWSYIPAYDYDDLTSNNDDADTAEEGDDDSEVFYRDIEGPPPIGVSVLLLYKGYPKPFIGSRIEGLIDGEYEYVDDCGSSEPPIFWSYLPKLPDIDLENADGV